MIRWAIAGPGRHAERSVVPAFRRAAGVELVAVMSRDAGRGAAFAARHGIARAHADFAALLADRGVDAIYDATPDGLHAQHAVEAAAVGKQVLVEKPLATTVAAGAAAVAAARRAGIVLGVVFNQRHEEAHVEARSLVRAGAIGEIVLAQVAVPLRMATAGAQRTWRNDPAFRPGGIGWSIGDHAFDTLSYLADQPIVEVASFTDATQLDPPNERTAALLLKLGNGAVGCAAATGRAPFARPPFEIHGTKGSLSIANSFVYLSGGAGDARPVLTIRRESGVITRHFAPSDCFRREIEQMSRAIAGDGQPMTTAEEGLRTVAIGEAVFAATRTGRTARVADFLA